MLWLCVAIASAYPTRDNTVNIAASPVSAEAQPAQTIAPVPEDWPIKCATDPCYTACTGWAEFFSMGGGCSKYHYVSCLVSQAFSIFLFVSFVSLLIKLITQKHNFARDMSRGPSALLLLGGKLNKTAQKSPPWLCAPVIDFVCRFWTPLRFQYG